MIRSPLGLRLQADQPLKEQFRQAAQWGAKGVAIEAIGELSPDRLSETGRREVRHALRSVELSLIAICLPTRRAFDSLDGLEDRLIRADRAFAMAFELGTRLVLARVGPVPDESETQKRQAFETSLQELSTRADHRGVRFGIETGAESGETLKAFLDKMNTPTLAASIDSAALLGQGFDPVTSMLTLKEHVVHAYAGDASAPSRNPKIGNPRGYGFAPGVLDWEEYLGAMEEIGYTGYLTVWPDPALPTEPQFQTVRNRAQRF